MTCADVEALVAELALGLVGGPERADALAHIDGCSRCRAMLDELSSAADELVLLAPPAEPPIGFEQRVLARLSPARFRRRSWVGVAIAAAAAVLLVAGGVALGRMSRPLGISEATMRTATGRDVGDAYLRGGDPAWVFVAVPGWTDTDASQRRRYTVRLTLSDGSTHDLAGGDLEGGQGAWGTVLDVDPAIVREVSLVGEDGRVWCSGKVT
jgi:hypothetical protein